MDSKFADDEILTQGLVADILSVSKETVRKWASSGVLVPCNGVNLYRWSDLKNLPQVQSMRLSAWDAERKIRPVRPFRSIELFAGAGGLALGLEKAGFDAVALSEFNRDACDTLRRNRPRWNVLEGDVAKVDFREFADIDLVSGGFPCQAFSYAGNRGGFADTRGTLFFEFARAVNEMRPRVFLGENVRGLLTHENGKTIEVIKSAIADLGYTLVPPEVLKAIFYRVPQKRERLALVGIRNDLANYLKDFRWPSPAQRVYTVRDALKKGCLFPTNAPASPGVSYTKWKADIIAKVPPGGYWRDLPLDLQKQLLKGSFHLEGGKTGIGRRLSWDEPSLTLTCAPAQNQTGRCHPSETRPLTVREYARLQTFPDDWGISGSVMSQYKQIGNAVPVNLAEALGRSLIALLNKMEKADSPRHGGQIHCKQSALNPSDRMAQLALFEPSALYLVHSSPVTLLGTYRMSCRDWIVANNLYNYPVTDAELDTCQYLRSVCRLVLQRKNDEPLYYGVNGYSITDKKGLAAIGYKVSKARAAKQKYILYQLSPLACAPQYSAETAVPIVGKGAKQQGKSKGTEADSSPVGSENSGVREFKSSS